MSDKGTMKNSRYRGFLSMAAGLVATLIVLIAILWVGKEYYFNTQKDSPDALPWEETFRIVEIGEEVPNLPADDQIQIEEMLLFRGTPTENGEDRGYLKFELYDNGHFTGMWEGNFRTKEPKRYYDILKGGFRGNVDSSKVYEDAEGNRDYTKLYLLGEGVSVFLMEGGSRGSTQVNAEFYIKGWLSPDYSFEGALVASSDRKTVKEYPFTSRAIPSSKMPTYQGH